MAFVDVAPTVTFTFVDETGSTSTATYSLAAATSVADARTAAAGLLVQLKANSDCSVQGYAINFPTIDTAPEAPAAGSRVERKGNFAWRTAAGKMARTTIPGIKDAVVLGSGRIDEDNADVAAYAGALAAAPWTDSNGAGLDTLVESYETYRSTTKRQLPTDRRTD
jgi:hypothetical protein